MAQPDLSQLKYEEGRSLMEAGNLDGAIESFRESAAHNPHFKTLELLGECLLKLGRVKEAVVPLAAATTLNNQIRAPSLLAEALVQLGDPGLAGTIAQRVLRVSPGNKRAMQVLQLPEVKQALATGGEVQGTLPAKNSGSTS